MDSEHELSGQVIDVAQIAEPAYRLVTICDSIERGNRPSLGQLNEILRELQCLPLPPGQLGADIALLASGGDDLDRDHVLAAIQRLRRVSSLRPRPRPTPRDGVSRRRSRRRKSAAATTLALSCHGGGIAPIGAAVNIAFPSLK